MAVYRRGYQRYQGPITSRRARFLVLPRFAWRRLFQQRLIALLLLVALIWPLLCAIFIYISNHAELLKGMGKQFQNFVEVKGNFFIIFMQVQASFAIFLAALAGPGLIAPDLANNALPLYFSRPLSRTEYALGRLTTLFGMLSLITWVPGLFLFSDAGWHGRQVVVQRKLEDRPWNNRRICSLDSAGEPCSSGRLGIRKTESRGGRHRARLFFHPERRLHNDQRGIPIDMGQHIESDLGYPPVVVCHV